LSAHTDNDEITDLHAEIAQLQAALAEIERWSHAYPLEVFPEPDLKRAADLLRAGGITLDAVSASAMRHVIEGVGEIARRALNESRERLR
jgi:hypothetical protein